MPQRQQLAALVRAAVVPRALERPRQQRVRERLPRDPLGVQRIGLAALAGTVRPWRAIRAHVPHVIPATGEEHRRVTTPARGALHPPPRDRSELPRPRLKRTVPIARHTEMLAREQPTTGIHDGRRQAPLMRIDADHVAREIRRQQHARRTRPSPPRHDAEPPLRLIADPVDNVPVGIGTPKRSTLLSGQTGSSKTRTEADTSSKGHQRVQTYDGSDPVRSSTVTPTVASAGKAHFNTGTYEQ